MTGNTFGRRAARGGRSVDGKLKGARWQVCRRTTFARANGRCQRCGKALDLKAPIHTARAYECDHYPVPRFVKREAFEAGRISLVDYDRWLKDPANCRAVCHPCHKMAGAVGEVQAAPDLGPPDGGTSRGW